MGNIEFDFYTSGQILQQVEDMIHRMNTEILNGFQDIIEWTSKSWDSESGNKFCDIAEKEMEKLKGTEKLMEHAAVCLQEAIITAKDTEEKVKEIAEIRTY